MKEEKTGSLIHLKFNHNEAIDSKKEILFSERSMMVMAGAIKEYVSLKTQEVDSRIRLHKKLKEATASIRKLQKAIPNVEIPKILKKEEPLENGNKRIIKTGVKKEVRSNYDPSIESQLQDIQEKLRTLQE